jgi:hypothetical protein
LGVFAPAGNFVLVFRSLAVATAIFAAGVGDAIAIRMGALLSFAGFHFVSLRKNRISSA